MRCTASTRPAAPGLSDLGLALVIDLRESDERAERPERLDGIGHREVHLPVYTGRARQHRGATFTAEDLDLGRLYAWMLGEHGAALTDAVRLIADSGADPVLVALHCRKGPHRLVIGLYPCRGRRPTTGDSRRISDVRTVCSPASGWTR